MRYVITYANITEEKRCHYVIVILNIGRNMHFHQYSPYRIHEKTKYKFIKWFSGYQTPSKFNSFKKKWSQITQVTLKHKKSKYTNKEGLLNEANIKLGQGGWKREEWLKIGKKSRWKHYTRWCKTSNGDG